MSSLVTVYVKEGVGRLETSQLPTSLFSHEKRNEGSGWKKEKKRKKLPSQQHGLLVKSSSIYNIDVYI
jgi:hypothetical protein